VYKARSTPVKVSCHPGTQAFSSRHISNPDQDRTPVAAGKRLKTTEGYKAEISNDTLQKY
jgi:hypothetical protein